METKAFLKTAILLIFLLFVGSLYSKTLQDRISLNLKNADVHDLLVGIAQGTGYNLVIPPNVQGKVTVFLDNVTLENALKIVTRMAGYDYYIEDNIIYIDTKKNIDARKSKVNLVSKTYTLNYAKAKTIETQIKDVLSNNGKVIIDERLNTIVVTDTKDKIKEVDKLIETLDKPSMQVMIEAKIVVVNNDASKELGLAWGGSFVETLSSNKYFYGLKGGTNVIDTSFTQGVQNSQGSITNDFPGADTLTVANKPKTPGTYSLTVPSEYAVNLPTMGTPAGGIGLIFGKWGYYNLSFKLTALKTKNLAKVISSPKVLTLNNQKASIGQGVEIPYKSVSDAGTNTQFKDAKLKLEVTPHITKNGRILLDVNLSKDSIGQIAVNGEPTINTQEINTKLLLKDGETAVIGGIIENTETNEETAVPLFSDIPLLGHLFKNKSKSFKKGELLIFITPKIVKEL